MSVAAPTGWRSKFHQLTRVYGTVLVKRSQRHLQRLEEEKTHRKIAKEMDLLHIPEENPDKFLASKGGRSIAPSKITCVGESKLPDTSVRTPAPTAGAERSGHWAKYRQNMFITHEQDRAADRQTPGCGSQR